MVFVCFGLKTLPRHKKRTDIVEWHIFIMNEDWFVCSTKRVTFITCGLINSSLLLIYLLWNSLCFKMRKKEHVFYAYETLHTDGNYYFSKSVFFLYVKNVLISSNHTWKWRLSLPFRSFWRTTRSCLTIIIFLLT